jgi:leucyl-tRNA synthetase
MHGDLIHEWIRTLALLTQPITPHFAEALWRDVCQESGSVQQALWPEVEGPENEAILKQLEYMRGVIGNMRSAEAQISKKKSKGKAVAFDPSKPRSARIIVATKYPEWQSKVMDALKAEHEASQTENRAIDDKNLRSALDKAGLLKDKKAMPFLQTMKVSRRTAPDVATSEIKCREVDHAGRMISNRLILLEWLFRNRFKPVEPAFLPGPFHSLSWRR